MYSPEKTSERCASIAAMTLPCAAETRAMASSTETATTGVANASANPLTVAIATLSPVNEPGPLATAMRPIALLSRPWRRQQSGDGWEKRLGVLAAGERFEFEGKELTILGAQQSHASLPPGGVNTEDQHSGS